MFTITTGAVCMKEFLVGYGLPLLDVFIVQMCFFQMEIVGMIGTLQFIRKYLKTSGGGNVFVIQEKKAINIKSVV
jgi:hypothetical protein